MTHLGSRFIFTPRPTLPFQLEGKDVRPTGKIGDGPTRTMDLTPPTM